MTIRDLKPHVVKRLATEGEDEFEKWYKETNGGKHFGTDKPLELQDVWRTAYGKGAWAILRRTDSIRE
jgi:hypothetical protein